MRYHLGFTEETFRRRKEIKTAASEVGCAHGGKENEEGSDGAANQRFLLLAIYFFIEKMWYKTFTFSKLDKKNFTVCNHILQPFRFSSGQSKQTFYLDLLDLSFNVSGRKHSGL